MSDLNNLDKEVLKGNEMNTDTVYELLRKMDTADSPVPDFQRIRNALFPKWGKRSNAVRFSRKFVTAACAVCAFLLLTTTVLAAWIIYERSFTNVRLPAYQTPPFETMDEIAGHIGENIMLPRAVPEGFTTSTMQALDFLTFKMILITYESRGEQVTLTIIYDFESIEDIFLSIPQDIAESATIEINGISVVQSPPQTIMGLLTSYWEIDGVFYILTGVYTLDELTVIINSIR